MHAPSEHGASLAGEHEDELERRLERGDVEGARALIARLEAQLGAADPGVRRLNIRLGWRERGAEAVIDQLAALASEHPADADLRHMLGLAHEELGQRRRMIAAFLETLRLDSADDESAGPVSPSLLDAIEARARAVLDALPAELARRLSKVPVILEARPSEHLVEEGFDPRALGLFEGAMMAEPDLAAPSRIVLYVHNLFEATEDDDDLLEEVEVTVLHEVGHYFGLDEDEVAELGLA